MESQNNLPTTSEENKQPSVASTVLWTEEDEERERRLRYELEQESEQNQTPATNSVSVSVSVSDVATVGDERLTCPTSEEPLMDDRPGMVEHFINMRCPESLECLVDPVVFPEDLSYADMELDVEMDAVLGPGPDGVPVEPRKKEEVINTNDRTINKLGKRRRLGETSATESENEESEPNISQRLRIRPRKTRVIEDTTTEDDTKEGEKDYNLPAMKIETITSAPSPSGDVDDTVPSGVDSAGQKKKKLIKKKGSPIAPKMHELINPENIKEQSLASLSALAMEWIDDLDVIRTKTNIQGVVSKLIKQRLELLREAFRHVHNQSLRPDNPNILQIRNARLVSDNNALQKELNQYKTANTHLERILTETRNSIDENRITKTTTKDAETSTMTNPEEGKTISVSSGMAAEIEWIKQKIYLLETNVGVGTTAAHEVPQPQRIPRINTKPIIKSVIDINSNKKVSINTCKNGKDLPGNVPGDDVNGGVMSLDPGPGSLERPDPHGPCSYATAARSPGAKSSLLMVPLAESAPATEKRRINKEEKRKEEEGKGRGKEKESGSNKDKDKIRKGNETTSRDEETEEWSTMERKKKRKKKKVRQRGRREAQETGSEKEGRKDMLVKNSTLQAKTTTGNSVIQMTQKRIPKSSAVVIRGNTEEVSYADVLTKLRNNIPLKEIGITNTKIKKTATGALLIEIPGNNTKEMAKELRNRAASILGNTATVTRPEIRSSIRVVGFDESVSATDIIKGIAKIGECDEVDVSVTPITPMRNGLYMTWIKCPVAAAVKASKIGKVTLGWTIARLELQKPDKQRCFRCWQVGHHKAACTSTQDRSKVCFRCGGENHKAAQCINEAKCIICEELGMQARHRTGSYKCEAVNLAQSQETVSNRRLTYTNKNNDDQDSTMQLK